MTTIGGGAKSPFFTTVKADVLGLTAIRSRVGDTALVGSAAIAGYGAGVITDYRKAILKTIQEEPAIHYNVQNHEQYKPMVQKYRTVIDATDVL
jgi:sugar (pentulose or hexulose) kinase